MIDVQGHKNLLVEQEKCAAIAHLAVSSALGHDVSLAFIESAINQGSIVLLDHYIQLIRKADRGYKALCDSPSKWVALASMR